MGPEFRGGKAVKQVVCLFSDMGKEVMAVRIGIHAAADGQQGCRLGFGCQGDIVGILGADPCIESVDTFGCKCPVLHLNGIVVLRVQIEHPLVALQAEYLTGVFVDK